MIDASAIQAIQDLAMGHQANANMPKDIGALVIPKTSDLKSIEPFQAKPNFFRANFKTSVLSEFINYINNSATDKTAIFINKDNSRADAIIDLGTNDDPEWGNHRARVELKNTPEYEALQLFNDKVFDQQDFIVFCEDWHPHIKFFYDQPTDTGTESFSKILAALRKLKVLANSEKEHAVGNFSASASALESIEIKAGNAEIPDGFLFEVVPYDGFDSIVMVCRLRAAIDDKSVKLKYRINRLDSAKDVIANEFRHKIIGGIDSLAVKIYVGDMAYQ